jgi:subtilisin family serine protease
MLYRQNYMRTSKIASLILAVLLCFPYPAEAATNDPLFPQQWGLQRIGAEAAWTASRGAGVLIAVIDTGVHLEHPDLKSQLVPGASMVDDRGAQDSHGHGTLIAGIAAATGSNGEGIVGVAPEAKILPIRVFDQQGSATAGRVASAIRFAVDAARSRRAKLVLNLSFVGPAQLSPGEGQRAGAIFGDEVVRKAITDAAAGGAAVITAAGNEGSSTTAFDAPPGKGIIVVGASDREDKCAPFTNYGNGLDILAPGVGVMSTFWNPNENRTGYANADGTSMAVPLVSGAAALLMSKGMTNVQAIERIIATASGAGVSCKGESTKYRVLDVALAISAPRDPQATAVPSPAPTRAIFPAGSESPEDLGLEGQGEAEEPAEEEIPIYELTWARGIALLAFLVAVNFLVALLRQEHFEG